MTRLLLVNESLDHDNWGSQACAATLREILREQVPGAEIDAIPSSWIKRRYGFDPHWRGRRLFKKAAFPQKQLFREHQVLPAVADEFETVAELWLQGRGGGGADEFLARLEGADAVVYNAEGSTYRTNYTAMKSLFLLWLARARRGIPAFFVNGSVTLTDTEPILPGMVRKTFGVLDGITVREPNSLRIVREWVPGVEAELVPDSVFHLAPGKAPDPRVAAWVSDQLGDRPFFCFSLSMLPSDLRRFRSRSATLELIQRLRRIVPDAVLMARDAKDQFLHSVAAETGAHFFGGDFDHHQALALLGGASFLCSGRYHHIIMASIAGCPSLALMSTSPKVQGLCELLGSDVIGPAFDPTDLRPHLTQVEEAARRAVAEGAPLRERLRKRADALRPRTARMGAIVAERLGA